MERSDLGQVGFSRGDGKQGDIRRGARFPDSHQLFVGNLPHNVLEKDVRNFFEGRNIIKIKSDEMEVMFHITMRSFLDKVICIYICRITDKCNTKLYFQNELSKFFFIWKTKMNSDLVST